MDQNCLVSYQNTRFPQETSSSDLSTSMSLLAENLIHYPPIPGRMVSNCFTLFRLQQETTDDQFF